MQRLSQAERLVMNALSAHITRNEEVSLTELADECHVAKSTVIKALKRAGFKGYQEFTANYRISRDMQKGALLPKKVVEGDEQAAIGRFVDVLEECCSKKGIVFSDGKRWAPLLADYVSRKLALFDIFAPASYDYAMVTESQLQRGIAIFFYHQERGAEGVLASGMGEGMVKTVKEYGYRTVIFTDSNEDAFAAFADVLIRITSGVSSDLDLFSTKVIMLIERALSELSARRAGKSAS